MATAGQLAPLHRVAVGQQDGHVGGVADHRGGEGRHHVRAVRVIGDASKSFGLALRAVHAIGQVEALEGGVRLWRDFHLGVEQEAFGNAVYRQPRVRQRILLLAQRLPVDGNGLEGQLLPVERQGRAGAMLRMAFQMQACLDARGGRVEVERQLGVSRAVGGRPVVTQVGRLRFGHSVRLLSGINEHCTAPLPHIPKHP